MIIAIDGPAASGKGTIARRLASHFGLPHLDTGLLYRATARVLLDEGSKLDDVEKAVSAARGLALLDFDEERLRGREMGEAASVVALLPQVRAALIDMQRAFAARPQGAVLDGRDIGTVIAPEPEVIKFFVHASLKARAERRFKELQARGDSATYARVLQDMTDRDERDRSRGIAALKPAPDAYDLDTTGLSPDQVFQKALDHIQSKNRP
jgi:CMP/dCMP kinase